MDAKYKRLLQQQYEAIIKDLDVSDIQDRLYEKGYFSSAEYEWANATNKAKRTDRTRDLLATLIQSGNNAKYDIFVDSLQKDYDWLWMKLKSDRSTEEDISEDFEDSLSKGDVPSLPKHHVKRTTLEYTVASSLKQLARHKILALHGMLGSGKTCVAVGTLRSHPQLIMDTFKGVVFWLNLKNCKTDDDVIAQQDKLFRKTSMYKQKQNSFNMISSTSMSSIGSNGDSSSQYNIVLNSQELKDILKEQFAEPPLRESLLVLDDVNDGKILEAFNIGCKILITTRDTDVVANFQTQIIKVGSFLKSESLELFASFLNEPVSSLPRKAKRLHEVCTGSPFHIALIGAQLAENKEQLKHDARLWDQYVKKLEKKEFSFIVTRPSENPMKAVEMCINALCDDVRPLYKKLAILPDNVKVPAKVIAKLWNKDVEKVKSIMQQLKRKSLITDEFNTERKYYIYEVHDLIMNYLRTCWTEEDKVKLHNSFLNSYSYTKDHAPVEIVDDGYIAFYVGYHILNSKNHDEKWSLFKKLFLDLKFLGNKVRLTGPADVILDLQQYENYIVSGEFDQKLVHSIKAYLMTHGSDLHRYQCTDIIQSILQHESQGLLFTKASEIAQANCHKNELYFEFLHEQDVDDIKHSTIDVKEDITCVCFLGDYVLVGTETGVVKFFHNPTNKLRKEYFNTTASNGRAVKWIGVAASRNYPIVAALYYNGTVKLWNIDDIDIFDTEDAIEEESEEVQNNNLPCNVTITPDSRAGGIRNCRWSASEQFLITHTDHQIQLYSPTGDVISVISGFDSECFLVCCVPCNNDRYLAVATLGSKEGVEVFDLNTNNRVMTFEGDLEMEQVLDVLALPGRNKILTLTRTEVTQHTFTINKGNNTLESKVVITSDSVKSQMTFLAFVVNQTGTLLFVSTDDSRVICVDLKTNMHVFDLDNRRGNVIAMAVSEMLMLDEFPGYDVLLTGTMPVENTVKVWQLDTSYISHATNKNGKFRLTTKFDVSFLNTSSPVTPTTPSYSITESVTPKRHQSFNHREPKRMLQNTLSLDRQTLKPLILKGICNNNDSSVQPLLAVIDDKNNIQVMRGRKIITEISEDIKDLITTVRISPCNQNIVYGLKSGIVKKYTLRSKDTVTIMDMYSTVQYMGFVNPNLLIVAGENRSIMGYKLVDVGKWETVMLQKGNTFLGSQELLNDLQGVKKKHSDSVSNSESHCSLDSKERTFLTGDKRGTLSKSSNLVECFWITDIGLVTVENNASIKLWDKGLKVGCVLNARREEVHINCAAFKNNVLVICDSNNLAFQTFLLDTPEDGGPLKLNTIREQKLNNVITCCDLTADGNLLALGLDSGDVSVWNVKGHRQVKNGLLRHHKHRVQSCAFSPLPDRLYRNNAYSSPLSPSTSFEDDQPPLVLVTMASEMVWWNITYNMRRGNGKFSRPGVNVNALTPLGSPLDIRPEMSKPANHNPGTPVSQNFFFADGFMNHNCWKDLWKGKTYKQGSKRKEILACIKLSGIHARRLSFDERFSCFVTVDNTGHVHIMNVLRNECS